MPQKIKIRTTSRLVAESPGCAPLKEAYDAAVAAKPKTWKEVEGLFLRGMEGFDANVVSGKAGMGDLQNGKGDFFNDLLALLLENCAEVVLYSRSAVPGLIFPRHNLDVTYPSIGTVQFTLEAKAVGTPKHPGSPKEKALGRPGSADLDKRIKEIGFKAIDLKAELGRIEAGGGRSPTAMSGDLTTWLRAVKPTTYVFFAARVVGVKDHARAIRFAEIAGQVSDGVGLFCYGFDSASTVSQYDALPVPSPLDIGRVLYRACQDVTAIKKTSG